MTSKESTTNKGQLQEDEEDAEFGKSKPTKHINSGARSPHIVTVPNQESGEDLVQVPVVSFVSSATRCPS